MIGLFGNYQFSKEAFPDISKMQATVTDGYICEMFADFGCAMGRVSHDYKRSGSIAESDDLTVLLSGEIFDLKVCEDSLAKSDNAAALILSLAKFGKLNQLKNINGQFCAAIYNRKNHTLNLITDRLATFPIHIWKCSENIIFATQLYTLIADPKISRQASFEALAQLFTMQRTIGRTTPISDVEALPAGSIIELSAVGKKEHRYWNLEWQKPDFSIREGAELLAVALKNAVRRQSLGRDVGLLLSGGFDSRAILAAGETGAFSSWTTASYETNPELAVARKAASLYSSEHHSLIIEPQDTLEVIDQTVIDSGGLYPASTPMSAFLPMVGKTCKSILSGHGLDYTLRGYYLPAQFIEIFGSRTRLPILKPIPKNPTAIDVLNYLRQGPPRQTIDKLIRRDKRAEWWQSLHENMQNCLEPWLESDQPYNAWDAFILHSVSKHYAFTGMMSVRAVGDLRLPAFDNEVFELYLRMAPAWRCSGVMAQQALGIISSDACRIENANTGFKMGLHPWAEVFGLFLRGALRRLKVVKRPTLPSTFHSLGSWQNLDALYRDEPNHRAHFNAISDRIDSLSFGILDHDALNNCIKEHLEGSSSHTKLLRQILTHDAWVRTYNIESTSCLVE